MSQTAHSVAIKSFDSNHESYDQLRPNFQIPVVKKLLADLKLTNLDGSYKTDKVILELAAGTGKFTKNLVDFGWSKNLIIVEPSQGMLESFKNNFPDITAHQGSSYSIPLSDNSVDSIVIAQGFHWFSDENSLKEMKRVLKPSGTFGCIWNFDGTSSSQQLIEPKPQIDYLLDEELQGIINPTTDTDPFEVSKKIMTEYQWNNMVTDYMYSFDVNVPQYRRGDWKQLLMNNDIFKPIQVETYYYYKLLIAQTKVYEYWLTRSYITDLPDQEKEKVRSKINLILQDSVTEKDKLIKDGVVYLMRVMGCHSIVTEPA